MLPAWCAIHGATGWPVVATTAAAAAARAAAAATPPNPPLPSLMAGAAAAAVPEPAEAEARVAVGEDVAVTEGRGVPPVMAPGLTGTLLLLGLLRGPLPGSPLPAMAGDSPPCAATGLPPVGPSAPLDVPSALRPLELYAEVATRPGIPVV